MTKKKDESTISQMGSGSSLSVIPAVPVQYMPNVEVWTKESCTTFCFAYNFTFGLVSVRSAVTHLQPYLPGLVLGI